MGIALVVLLLSATSFADTVVIMGTPNLKGDFNDLDDTIYQKADVCKSIESASALGHDVHLFIPPIQCGSTKYNGNCPETGCTKADYTRLFNRLAVELTSAKRQNLLIQTIGHGGRGDLYAPGDHPPEETELKINSLSGMSAKDFAHILVDSGIFKKVSTTRGLWTQCYSGGWNEISRLVHEDGKFCSISATDHERVATISGAELDGLKGSAFIHGFWDSQKNLGGRSTLSESIVASSLLLNSLSPNDSIPFSDYWKTSSIYFSEKASEGEFSDGLNAVAGNPLFNLFKSDFECGMESVHKKVTRFKMDFETVTERNRSRPFWRRASAFPLVPQFNREDCPDTLLEANSRVLAPLFESLRDLEGGRDPEVNAKLIEWNEKLLKLVPDFKVEVTDIRSGQSHLLEQSAALIKNHQESRVQALQEKFWGQETPSHYPQLKIAVGILKEMQILHEVLKVHAKLEPGPVRDNLLEAWKCENQPVFMNASKR